MIEYLKLKNFRKHREAHFDFGPGLNVICGENWVGKTTILSAIAYALFGTKAAQGTAADLVTDGESEMVVQVGFSVGGAKYFVTRGPKKADLRAFSAGHKPIATGQTPVTEEIESLIGSSTKDFLDFNVTRQEDSSNLLNLGSAKLGEYVARVTGIDTVDDVLGRLKTEAIRSEATAGAHQDQSEKISSLEAEIADMVGAANRSKASLQQLAVNLEFKGKENSEKADRAKKLRKDYDSLQETRRNVTVQKGILTNAENMLKTARDACPAVPEGDLADLEVRYQTDKTNLEFAQWHDTARLEMEQAVSSAKENLALYGDVCPESPNVRAAMGVHEVARAAISAAEHAYKQAREASDSSQCPYCMRPFENMEPDQLEVLAKEAEQTVIRAQEAGEAAAEKLQEAYDKRAAATAWTAGKNSWQHYLEESEQLLNDHLERTVIRVSAEQVQESLEQVSQLQGLWDTYNKAIEIIARREKDVKEAKQTLQAMGNGTKSKGPTAGDVESAERDSQAVLGELYELTIEKNALENAISTADNSIGNKDDLIGRLKREQKLREAARQRLSSVKELQAYLRKNRERFTESFWAQLLEHASEFVRSATSGAVSAIGVGNGFTYIEDGRERSVAGNASGMQKAIFSTAIKLSLVAALGAKFDVLFFDEVTAAAGDDTSLLFTGLLAKAGQQSLLVTHRQADASVADQLIEVVSH